MGLDAPFASSRFGRSRAHPTGARSESSNIGTFLFAVLLACNLLVFSGRFHSLDEVALLATTESLVKWQRADINSVAWMQWFLPGPDQQGRWAASGDLYAKKAPLVSWVAAPLYAISGLARARQVQASMLLGAFVTALTAVLLYRFARGLGFDTSAAIAGALLLGLGSGEWVYSRHLFSEPLAALGLLLAVEGLWRCWTRRDDRRALRSAGIGLALAVLSNLVYALLMPVFLVAAWWAAGPGATAEHGDRPEERPNRARALDRWFASATLVAPVALAALLVALWNLARFGNPLVTGYHWGSGEGFSAPLWMTVPALLVSPARGLVWFFPASLLSIAGVRAALRIERGLTLLTLALIASHLLVFGAWWMWWGGWGWGPRFLLPLSPLLVLLALPVLQGAIARPGWRRRIVILICAASLCVQILGAGVGFDEFELEQTRAYPAPAAEQALYAYGMHGLWRSWPILGNLRLLLSGRTDLAWLPGGRVDWLLLLPLVLWLSLGLWWLSGGARERREPRAHMLPGRSTVLLGCGLMTILLLARAGGHPLRASYAWDPIAGRSGLEAVAARSRPGDGALLVRSLTPGELDRCPRFPRVYGIPDAGILRSDEGVLDRLTALAASRHHRLWMIVRSEHDPAAAAIERRLNAGMRRVEARAFGNYEVVLFAR